MMNRTSLTRRFPFLLVFLAALSLLLAACGDDDSSKKTSSDTTSDSSSQDSSTTDDDEGGADPDVASRADSYDAAPDLKLDPKEKYVVELDTDKGKIRIDIDQKAGPIAAANFVALVKDGFYDGIVFHRIVEGFMIQSGDPTGTGAGGPGYEIQDDPVNTEYEKGTLAMANRGPNTGSSQFFIVQGDGSQLSPDYSIFGKVQKDSLDVVDELAAVETEDNGQGEVSRPTKTVKITSAKLVEGKLPS